MFKLLRAVLVAASAICLPLETARANTDVESLKSGFWVGGYRVFDDGSPNLCYLNAQHGSEGYIIYLVWTNRGFQMSLYDDSWKFADPNMSRAQVKIDRRFDELLETEVYGDNLVNYYFGFEPRSWQAVQKGAWITMDTPQGRKKFRLTGTGKAVDVILDCARRHFGSLEPPSKRGNSQSAATTGDTQTGPAATAPETGQDRTGSSDLSPAERVAAALELLDGGDDADVDSAMAMIVSAAEDGDREGMWLAGRMAEAGIMPGYDKGRAAAWMLAAAEAGHPEALTYLGARFLSDTDPVKRMVGEDYLARAAAQGHGEALAARRFVLEEAGQ